MKIAALEDDETHAQIIAHTLMGAGLECETFSTGHKLRQRLREDNFDALIIDWHLPDISGRDFVAWFRNQFGRAVPLLFVTSRNMEEDVVEGLNAGADDYMTKPIRPNELVARVQALLRRAYATNRGEAAVIQVGPYRIDVASKVIALDGKSMSLTPREFELARVLFQRIDQLLPRDLLMQALWGRNVEAASRTLDTHLSRLRTKLQLRPENGVKLTSVYSQGYRLETVPMPNAEETSGN